MPTDYTLMRPERLILNSTPTHEFTSVMFQSHDNRECTLRYREMAWWNDVTGNDGAHANRESIVFATLLDACPAADGCTTRHTFLLHARNYDGYWYIRDLGLCILHDFHFERVEVIGTGNNFRTAMQNFIDQNIPSFQSHARPNHRDPNPYVLTSYEADPTVGGRPFIYATSGNGTSFTHFNVSPDRRLITIDGETMWWADPNGESHLYLAGTNMTTGITTPTTTDMVDGVADAPIHTPDEDVPLPSTDERVTQLEAQVTSLTGEVERQRVRIAGYEETIRIAKDTATRYTRNNGGCDDGKRQFLTDLGLHDDDEIDEFFDSDYVVYVDVPVTTTARVSVTVRAVDSTIAREMVEEDPSSYIGIREVIDGVGMDVYNTDWDADNCEITDVELA